jgi:hypothetical protein
MDDAALSCTAVSKAMAAKLGAAARPSQSAAPIDGGKGILIAPLPERMASQK